MNVLTNFNGGLDKPPLMLGCLVIMGYYVTEKYTISPDYVLSKLTGNNKISQPRKPNC